MEVTRKPVLLIGATGYVGGRLLRALEEAGCPVRCLARRPQFLQGRVASTTEVMQGNVLDPFALRAALEGIDAVYYLMPSITAGEKEDLEAATCFAQVALAAGVRRIIYLGALGGGKQLSTQLASRQAVGQILHESGVPTLEFRAPVIIGSGSLSFEMIRGLVDHFPILTPPRWTRTRTHFIAIEDVIAYLLAAGEIEWFGNGIFEIGGPEQVSYTDIMKEYARQRGLKRIMIPIPLWTLGLSSLWVGLVTPIYARLGRRLIEQLSVETLVRENSAPEIFGVKPRDLCEAIERALNNEDQEIAQTRWSDALSSKGAVYHYGGMRYGSRLIDSRSLPVPCSPAEAFRAIERIGGKTGWYYANWLWRLRGFLDLLVGGVGMRRGRRDQEHLCTGDTVDFWRVEAIEPGRLLRLAAEMKLSGRAWLQFEIERDGSGSIIRQTAIFDPLGLWGLLYWYALYPVHHFVFEGMLRGIAAATGRYVRSESQDKVAVS